MKRVLTFGLIAAAITTLPTAISLFSDSTILLENAWIATALGLLLPLTFMVVGGIRERKADGGFMTYGKALKITYVIYAVTAIVGILFTVIFHNVIDPGYMERHRETMVKVSEGNFRKGMEMVGASEAQIMEAFDEQSEALERSIDDQMKIYKDPAKMTLTIFVSLFLGILLALLAALFVRKNPKPETA